MSKWLTCRYCMSEETRVPNEVTAVTCHICTMYRASSLQAEAGAIEMDIRLAEKRKNLRAVEKLRKQLDPVSEKLRGGK